jgi:hypothetical protein
MASNPLKWNVLGLCAAVMGASTAHAANLLTNGSFESGGFVNQGADTMSLPSGSTTITGWTVVTDTTAWIGPANPFGLLASDGDYFLDLTNYQPGAPFAGVTQTIATIPGATYSLSFDLGGSNFWGRPDSLTASAAGTSKTFVTPGTGTNDDWYHETMTFVAASSSTLIDLQGASGINYLGLDNASVEFVSAGTVPEPSSLALMFAGLLTVAAGARRHRRD